MGEAVHLLFWAGGESPSESYVSLSGVAEVNRESNLIKNPNRDTDEYYALIFSIKFL